MLLVAELTYTSPSVAIDTHIYDISYTGFDDCHSHATRGRKCSHSLLTIDGLKYV